MHRDGDEDSEQVVKHKGTEQPERDEETVMGCDIHLYVEAYDTARETWQAVNDVIDRNPEGPQDVPLWQPYGSRNYSLFAMLAGVRNNDPLTGDPVTPISASRGLPDDVSKEIRRESDDWSVDGHSHTWLSLNELLQVQWDTERITLRGYVDAVTFDGFRHSGRKPQMSCADIGGGNIRKVTNDVLAKLIDDLVVPTPWNWREYKAKRGLKPHETYEVVRDERRTYDIQYYTQVSWTETWAEAAHFDTTLRQLAQLAHNEELDAENVRIVMWFDN